MSDFPPELISYMAARERHRARQVDAALERRTPDELRLMKEAAVMGYVQGTMAGREVAIPKDSDVLRMVVGACLAMADLYPMISGYVPDEEEDDR